MNYTYGTIAAPQPPSKDQEINLLKDEVERLKKMLDSYDSDVVYFRDLIHTLYATHDQARQGFRASGNFKMSRYHFGQAVAYRAALEHFDSIRKIR